MESSDWLFLQLLVMSSTNLHNSIQLHAHTHTRTHLVMCAWVCVRERELSAHQIFIIFLCCFLLEMLSLALLAPGKRCLSVTTTLVLRAKMSPRLSRPSFFRRKIGQTSVSPTLLPNKRKSFLNQHKKSETRNTKHLGKGAFHGGLRNRGEASCERQHYSVVRK